MGAFTVLDFAVVDFAVVDFTVVGINVVNCMMRDFIQVYLTN